MEKIVRLTTLTVGLIISLGLRAQSPQDPGVITGGNLAITAHSDDYYSGGINPANLAWMKNKVSLGFLESEFSFPSTIPQGLMYSVKQKYRNSGEGNANDIAVTDLFNENQLQKKGVGLMVEFMPVGIAWNKGSIGTFSLTLKTKNTFYTRLNPFASKLLYRNFDFEEYFDALLTNAVFDTLGLIFDKRQILKLMHDSHFGFEVTQAYGFSYGKTVMNTEAVDVAVGVGLSYIQGFAHFNLTFNREYLEGFASTSPFLSVDYSAIHIPDTTVPGRYRPTGHGVGLEGGISININDKHFAGISVIDVGFINWKGYDIQFKEQLSMKISKNTSNMEQLEKDVETFVNNNLLDYKGTYLKMVPLPAKIRLGSYSRIDEKAALWLDIVAPLNREAVNKKVTAIGGGMDFRLSEHFSIASGIVGTEGIRLHFPFSFTTQWGSKVKYQFGIATNNIYAFFDRESESLSLGNTFLRFLF